jgi:hypothetical protein
LEASLAALAPIALRAFEITKRPVPPKLAVLAATIDRCIPSGEHVRYGEPTGRLAAAFRSEIYGGAE